MKKDIKDLIKLLKDQTSVFVSDKELGEINLNKPKDVKKALNYVITAVYKIGIKTIHLQDKLKYIEKIIKE